MGEEEGEGDERVACWEKGEGESLDESSQGEEGGERKRVFYEKLRARLSE